MNLSPPPPPPTSFVPHPLLYIALHPDLHKLSAAQAQKHYLEYGIKEKRVTTIKHLYPDFRADMYHLLNTDIPKSNNEYDAQLHYLVKGRFENRRYKPAMDKEFIYLYTTNETHKQRCTQFCAILDKLQIAYVITNKCSSLKSNLYILFTTDKITTTDFPFYYILNLDKHETCRSVPDILEQYCLAKLPPLDTPPTLEMIQRCLVGSEFLDMSILPTTNTPKLAPRTIHVLVKQMPSMASSHQTFYIPKLINNRIENVSDALTLKHTIAMAKQQNMPFIAIANEVSPMLTTQIINKVFDFLEKHDDWDLCIHEINNNNSSSSITNVQEILEIIQLDIHTKLLRSTRLMNGNFCIYNTKVFDNILQWNHHNPQQGTTIDTYLGSQHLNVFTIGV